MRLEDKRDALDGRGVSAFAAFDEALFDERRGIGEQCDAFAGFAFAAEVVFEALAVGGLRKHARQCVFAHAARAGKEQSVGNAVAAERATEGGDDAFIAEEVGEAHASAGLLCERWRQNLQYGGENFRGDVLLGAHGAAGLIETRDGCPVWALG